MKWTDWLQLVFGLVGVLGGGLGIWSWWTTHKINTLTLDEMVTKKREAKEEDQLFKEMMALTDSGQVYTWRPEIDSKDFEIMTRLVLRGLIYWHGAGATFTLHKPN